jgi:hypothetical protein
VQGNNKERWLELCNQPSNEQAPNKLIERVKEINRLLETGRHRLDDDDPPSEYPENSNGPEAH